MFQVKIFEMASTLEALEVEINEWLRKHPNIKSPSFDQFRIPENHVVVCTILYQENEQPAASA